MAYAVHYKPMRISRRFWVLPFAHARVSSGSVGSADNVPPELMVSIARDELQLNIGEVC